MRDAFIRALTILAERDPSVVLLTGDLGFGVLTEFARRFPKQFVNVGVAEQNMTTIAAGMALEGHRVYTYSIANFTTLRCLEQIRNDVCYHDANVTVVSVGGGFSYGQLGMSHFATEDLAILRALPNMTVVAPTEVWETEDLTMALAERQGPCYLRLDKGQGGVVRMAGETAMLGKMRRVREGTDVTLVAVGAIVSEALEAAAQLAVEGCEARILAVHTLKPLDAGELLAAARETGGIVTIEEHSIIGGLGGACAEVLIESNWQPTFFRRVGLADVFPTVVGDQNYLRAAYRMDAAAIVDSVRVVRSTSP
jgi:transketolase